MGLVAIYACAVGSCALIRVLNEFASGSNALWPIEGEEEVGEVVEET